jgi:hypothetical protein
MMRPIVAKQCIVPIAIVDMTETMIEIMVIIAATGNVTGIMTVTAMKSANIIDLPGLRSVEVA